MNKVSVIIPVYNVEKYLRECLDSVICQTLREIEILCVNDASIDGSLSILREYEAKDSRIRVINQPKNKGLAATRNVGLQESNSEYIYFLDSDDFLSNSEALDILYNEAMREQANVVVFNSQVIYETEKLREKAGALQVISDPIQEGNYSGREYFFRKTKELNFTCAVWRQFWSRPFLMEKGLCFQEDTSLNEDSLFSFQAMLSVDTLVYTPKILHTYRVRENSAMTMPFGKNHLLANCRSLFASLRFIEKQRPNRQEEEAFYQYLKHTYTYITDHVASVIQGGEDLNQAVMETGWDAVYLRLLLLGDYPRLGRLFTPDECRRMGKSKMVVVYGNGMAARDVKLLLCRFGIEDYQVAVTRKKPGSPENIHEIAEFASYGGDCFVIVAVTQKYRREMESMLDSLGLTQYVYLGE